MINDLLMCLYNPPLSRARTRARAHPCNSMYPKMPKTEGLAKPSPAPLKKANGRRVQVRRSGVHGKGVFALVPLAKGETIMEYTGPIITWKEALRRHPH